MGAHVVMACRSPERAERAHEQLLHEVPGAKATLAPLDVSNPSRSASAALSSVHASVISIC
jgi:hypothetical protein